MTTRYDEGERDGENVHGQKRKIKRRVLMGVGAGLLAILGMRSCATVSAGHVAVVDTFGSVSEAELEPGIHFPVSPFAKRVEMNTQTKEIKETMKVPTSEGLMAKLDVSLLYKINAPKANQIYVTVGEDYEGVIVEPVLRNGARDVIAGHPSEDLYNANRHLIEIEMDKKIRPTYAERGIELEKVLLRDVELPGEVTSAIERKIKAKQEAEQMQYVLDKERSEATRKGVEADGIALAQHKIDASLTQQYLQWRYITTLESLANSPNTTFVITPYDGKLLPMLPLEESKHASVIAPKPGEEKK